MHKRPSLIPGRLGGIAGHTTDRLTTGMFVLSSRLNGHDGAMRGYIVHPGAGIRRDDPSLRASAASTGGVAQSFHAGPGSYVYLPHGGAHRFSSSGGPARMLLMAIPGGIEHYFQEINTAVGESELHRVGEKYGIRMVTEIESASDVGTAFM